jgi:UDP-N-acetylmuramyl tripeptide synthase
MGLDAAILTNIRRDPSDAENSLVSHRRVQARLFEQLNPNGFAVLNVDDAASQPLLDKLEASRVHDWHAERSGVIRTGF